MADYRQINHSELDLILDCLRQTLAIDGDVVEFGCYAGDTSVELASVIKNIPDKWLWLYDSFEGLPEKSEADLSTLGWRFKEGELKVSESTIEHKFKKLNLPDPVIKKAWFNQLDPKVDLPNHISFALLDGDFYDSIKTSLNLVFPKMSPKSIVTVHDYRNPALPGSAKAVDEFINHHRDLAFRVQGNLAVIEFPANS